MNLKDLISKFKKFVEQPENKKTILIIGAFVLLFVIAFVNDTELLRSDRDPYKTTISPIAITNGTKEPERLTDTPPIDYIPDVQVKEDAYTIQYYPTTNFYQISILESPFEENRLLAEQRLLKELNLPEFEACRLNYSIGTPAFANPDEAGKNYKFSFCEFDKN